MTDFMERYDVDEDSPLGEIFTTFPARRPLDHMHLEEAVAVIRTFHSKGRELWISDPELGDGSFEALMQEGILVVSAPILHADFVYVHLNAGRNVFGQPKSKFTCMVVRPLGIREQGPKFTEWHKALSRISNVFRALKL